MREINGGGNSMTSTVNGRTLTLVAIPHPVIRHSHPIIGGSYPMIGQALVEQGSALVTRLDWAYSLQTSGHRADGPRHDQLIGISKRLRVNRANLVQVNV